MRRKFSAYFYWFELISVVIFTLEYLWRLKVAKKWSRFAFSFFGLIDLIAILPFYLPMLIKLDLRFVRILRLSRIFRIFKVARYAKSMQLVGLVLKEKKEALALTLFLTFIMLLVASSLMYEVEHRVQPDKFTDIFSSFWWAVATLTTIGYGDIYPMTTIGRFLSGVIALLGIGLVALPTGIIGSGFIEILERKKTQSKIYCPHCGKEREKKENHET
jgi:voltage-gated potassium channel